MEGLTAKRIAHEVVGFLYEVNQRVARAAIRQRSVGNVSVELHPLVVARKRASAVNVERTCKLQFRILNVEREEGRDTRCIAIQNA
eukprot:SAG11_NODE_612_length_8206_cov_4.251110_3_plen_86_part_00